jgi:hypothetical protein
MTEEAWQARAVQAMVYAPLVEQVEAVANQQVIRYAVDACHDSEHFGFIVAHTACQNIKGEIGWCISSRDAKRWRAITTADLHMNPNLLDQYKGNKIGIVYNRDPYTKWVKLENVSQAPPSTYLEVSEPRLSVRGGFSLKQKYNINNLGLNIIATDQVEHIPNGNAPDGWHSRDRYVNDRVLSDVSPVGGPDETAPDPRPPWVRYQRLQPWVEIQAREAGRAAREAAERLVFSSSDPNEGAEGVSELLDYIGSRGSLQAVENMRRDAFDAHYGFLPSLVRSSPY